MAAIRLVTVGKLKERYWVEAQGEYLKRLRPYLKLELKEVADLPCPENAGAALEEQVRQGEAALIESLILPKSFLVTFDLRGKQMTSPELAEFFNKRMIAGQDVTLVIGGSLGLTAELVQRSNLNLSFSKLTFPHQLFRVMLLEQIYRACKIMRGEKYHK